MDVFKAVADPTRRRILDLLARKPRTVAELVHEFSISQPAVSQHLAVLRKARLVAADVEGQRRRYRVTPAPLQELAQWVGHYESFWDAALDRLGEHLRGVPDGQ